MTSEPQIDPIQEDVLETSEHAHEQSQEHVFVTSGPVNQGNVIMQ